MNLINDLIKCNKIKLDCLSSSINQQKSQDFMSR